MRGVHLSERFDNDKSLKLIELMNFDQATKMIDLQRVEAIAGNAFALAFQLQKLGVLEKVDLGSQLKLGEKEQWLQLSKKSKNLELLPALEQSITELKNNGVFEQILVKYYGSQIIQK
jgi:ABC-type amino acid transport substrate-binding protein